MAEDLDWEWMHDRACDTSTRDWLRQIQGWREYSLTHNQLNRDDRRFELRLRDGVYWLRAESAFCALEVYQEIFRDHGHTEFPGFEPAGANVVVDIGANFGFYAMRVKQANPNCQIICYEPNPYVHPLLRQTLDANGFEDAVVLEQAVASKSGTIRFDLIRQLPSISGKGLRSVPRAWMRPEFIEQVSVDAVSLHSSLSSMGVDQIDILKVDVEGMEVDVLASADPILARTHRIVVERHSQALRDGVYSLLSQRGFQLIGEETFPAGPRYYGDMYFERK